MSILNLFDKEYADKPSGPLADLIVGLMLLILCLFFLLRIRIASPWFILAMSIVGGFGIYLIFSSRRKSAQKAFEKTTVGAVEKKLSDCQELIDKNLEEITEIRKSVEELHTRQSKAKDLNPTTIAESEKLIAAFEQEIALRDAKITFYDSCRSKLITLRDNQAMVEELALKQQKLKELQEGHYEELADMEALKYDLSHDTVYLETIEELSLKMLNSRSVNAANELQLELNEMTKELRRL